ncbi:hypothetical protein GCM10007981_09760 [Thermocladium modestius]|uniref:Roadblock/LAMTOR2 domain-containing protein n=1 Tax=Thermocladium modestius TaxID=62609 RepID=A0A830GUT6_9CREN|nr:roadblock/LC7 domain-containing protein [Thermocladium modestius]GGP20685.1 hypothetical protein GCM10007981_09760 [Thermocladium modestius]
MTIREVLQQGAIESPGILGIYLSTVDGLIKDYVSMEQVDPDKVSAVSAPLAIVSENASKLFFKGNFDYSIVYSSPGLIVVAKVDENNILTIVSKEQQVGFILTLLDSMIKKLRELLSSR